VRHYNITDVQTGYLSPLIVRFEFFKKVTTFCELLAHYVMHPDVRTIFERKCCIHLHDKNLAMQTKAVCSSERLIPPYLTTLHHNPEDGNMKAFSGCTSSVIYGYSKALA
jgi:hypothetical protein